MRVALGSQAKNRRHIALGIERLAVVGPGLRLGIQHFAAGRKHGYVVTDVDAVAVAVLIPDDIEAGPHGIARAVSGFRKSFALFLAAVETDVADCQSRAGVHVTAAHLEGQFLGGSRFAHHVGYRDGDFESAGIGQRRNRFRGGSWGASSCPLAPSSLRYPRRSLP